MLDVGMHGLEPVDYADYAAAVGAALREHRADRGIILCGSGVGASMAANRIPGIRAGLCHDTYSAHQGVEHDDMNVLVIGGRVVGVELARELVGAFLNARFTGEARHVRRLAKMTALENPLRAVQVFGQSVWLDNIRRSLITSGELQRMIEEDGLRGVTSNPAIFEKAIAGSSDYADILECARRRVVGRDVALREAGDSGHSGRGRSAPACTGNGGRDGYVSLEVSPLLAADTPARSPKRDGCGGGRPDNLMIKVPATPEGIPRDLAADCGRHQRQRHAALRAGSLRARRGGLHRRARGAGRARRRSVAVASVASFFVSRIDTAIDAAVDARLANTAERASARSSRMLRARWRLPTRSSAYQRYQELFSSARWRALGRARRADAAAPLGEHRHEERQLPRRAVRRGADWPRHRQHDAAADGGGVQGSRPSSREPRRGFEARTTRCARSPKPASRSKRRRMRCSPRASSCSATRSASCWTRVAQQSRGTGAERIDRRFAASLPAEFEAAVQQSLAEWQTQGNVRRLWARDSTLWTGRDEGQWLGWLGITNGQLARSARRKTSALACSTRHSNGAKGPLYWKGVIELDSVTLPPTGTSSPSPEATSVRAGQYGLAPRGT